MSREFGHYTLTGENERGIPSNRKVMINFVAFCGVCLKCSGEHVVQSQKENGRSLKRGSFQEEERAGHSREISSVWRRRGVPRQEPCRGDEEDAADVEHTRAKRRIIAVTENYKTQAKFGRFFTDLPQTP